MIQHRLPRWKQWILRHVIGDFEATSLGFRHDAGWRPEDQEVRTKHVWVRMANPGGVNTAQPSPEEVNE